VCCTRALSICTPQLRRDFADASNTRDIKSNSRQCQKVQHKRSQDPRCDAPGLCNSSFASSGVMSKPSGGSRLEKLLGLLESAWCFACMGAATDTRGGTPLPALVRAPLTRCADGSTPGTRRAAGEQVANIVKAHPGQLPSVVRKATLSSLSSCPCLIRPSTMLHSDLLSVLCPGPPRAARQAVGH